jgi:hypothetical protein
MGHIIAFLVIAAVLLLIGLSVSLFGWWVVPAIVTLIIIGLPYSVRASDGGTPLREIVLAGIIIAAAWGIYAVALWVLA